MKKKFLMAAIAAMIAMPATAALAAPVQMDGEIEMQYSQDNATKKDGGRFTLKLNAKTNVAKNLDFYGRFAAQGITEQEFRNDFRIAPGAYSKDTKSMAEVDQFGFLYNNAGVNYKLGRQGGTIGGTALLYSTEGYVGRDMMADGITVKAKSGVTDLSVTALKEVYGDSNKAYAVSGSYKPAKDWTLGATLARYDAAATDRNYWAVNTAYEMGKATFAAEYAKSNAGDANKAYDLGVSYAFDKKLSASATYYRVENNGDMGGWTDFDPNMKGFYYGLNYKPDSKTAFKFLFKDIEQIDNSAVKSKQFRATISYLF